MYQRPFALLAAAGVCISLTACSEAWRAWWEDHDGPGGGGAAGSPAPGDLACGSRGLPPCPDDTFCSFPEAASCGDADAPGSCEPRPTICTRIYAPVCGCDGQTYASACEANAAGVSVRSEGECGEQACGGRLGSTCSEDQYCNYPPEAICGRADGNGVCTPKPGGCTKQYQPVCGCDGQTYGNACTAAAAGVSVESEGECPTFDCGGFAGRQCAEGQYCDLAEGQGCKVADASGVCKARPEICTLQYDPVCGCDGTTYSNACQAAAAGVTVEHEGECDAQPQSCKLGDTEFPSGSGVICSDGCNQCACDEQGRWISTLILCAPLPKVEACDPPAESTPGLAITKLYRAEDALALSVSHGGGCFEHSFKLCYAPAFAESNPVQTQLWLVDQSAEPDPCLALITRELVFDLSPIREQYSAQYPSGPEQIVLNLGRERIDYQF